MNNFVKYFFASLLINLFSSLAVAHGDVQPQPVDTTGLEDLGDDWLARNPYSGNETADRKSVV